MILQPTKDNRFVLFQPENIAERKKLEKFPGLLQEGLSFFSPNKPHIVYNLFNRLKNKLGSKVIRYTREIKDIIESEWSVKELPADFKFHTEPLPHQRIALRFCYTFENVGLLLEPGLGKTKIVLDYIYLMQFTKSLIVCPKALLFVWEEERLKHRPELSMHVFDSTDFEKEMELGGSKADIIVINYDKAVILFEDLKNLKLDFIGLDEGLIKDHTTERTRSLTKVSKSIGSRMVMSGTLVNNSPLDIFAPVRFIEPSLVGEGVTRFKDEYQITQKLRGSETRIPVGFRGVEEIKEILKSCSIIMTKDEWLDLPPKKFNRCYVQLSDKQRDYYQKLGNNYLLKLEELGGKEVEIVNPLTALIKLTQISNGFLYYEEDDGCELSLQELFGENKKAKKKNIADRKTFFFQEQPKAVEMLRLLNHELHGRRTIIWFNMSAEREIIERYLTGAGITYEVIAGGEKKIGEKVKRFNNDPELRCLVCQAKSINYGVTIMGSDEDPDAEYVPSFDPKVSDEIFYSLNFSLEIFLQQQDRIHRIGQTRECNYWLILSNSHVEKRIAGRLEEKLLCNKDILEDIAKDLELD